MDDKKKSRNKKAAVVAISLSLLGGGLSVQQGLKEVAKAFGEVKQALAAPQPVTCTSQFTVKPVPIN